MLQFTDFAINKHCNQDKQLKFDREIFKAARWIEKKRPPTWGQSREKSLPLMDVFIYCQRLSPFRLHIQTHTVVRNITCHSNAQEQNEHITAHNIYIYSPFRCFCYFFFHSLFTLFRYQRSCVFQNSSKKRIFSLYRFISISVSHCLNDTRGNHHQKICTI